jgi:hypothetical protein
MRTCGVPIVTCQRLYRPILLKLPIFSPLSILRDVSFITSNCSRQHQHCWWYDDTKYHDAITSSDMILIPSVTKCVNLCLYYWCPYQNLGTHVKLQAVNVSCNEVLSSTLFTMFSIHTQRADIFTPHYNLNFNISSLRLLWTFSFTSHIS